MEVLTLGDRDFALNQLKLLPSGLDAAAAFRAAIDLSEKPLPRGVRTFVMLGTRFSTITHFAWADNTIDKVETLNAGDGTVSLQGAYLPSMQTQFTGMSHVDLISSPEARLTFQEMFDADGLLAALDEQVKIDVRDIVDGPMEVRFRSEHGLTSVHGEIYWERLSRDDAKAEPDDGDFAIVQGLARQSIDYSGPPTTSLLLSFDAPAVTGIYRLRFARAGKLEAASRPFVVRPKS